MSTAIIFLTKEGGKLAERLVALLPCSTIVPVQGGIAKTLARVWQEHERMVCIMAAGIAVRSLAPLLRDKRTDPAAVVCDPQGRFAISLLSGHLGGGNALARQVAALLGGQAVITTASDVLGHAALDLWAQELGLVVADPRRLTAAMSTLVNSGTIALFSEYPLPKLPPDLLLTNQAAQADILITCRTAWNPAQTLLHPKTLVAGIGCNRGTLAEDIIETLHRACAENSLAVQSVRNLATIDLKQDEAGLLAAAAELDCSVDFYTAAQLNQVKNVETSAAALRATGAKGVAEPAAMLSSRGGRLLLRKQKSAHVTVAIAEVKKNLLQT
jgi:cobalt-precorrin 5A hydrolase